MTTTSENIFSQEPTTGRRGTTRAPLPMDICDGSMDMAHGKANLLNTVVVLRDQDVQMRRVDTTRACGCARSAPPGRAVAPGRHHPGVQMRRNL
jgi:hypothetical protein